MNSGGFIMYTIGQVAEMFQIPVSTLRYYDNEGLFPTMERQSGIRKFSDKELETLHVIDCLKRPAWRSGTSDSSCNGVKRGLPPIRSEKSSSRPGNRYSKSRCTNLKKHGHA